MKNHHRWMRGILFAGAIALLLSCGGGGGGGSSVGGLGTGSSVSAGAGSDNSAGTGTGGASTGTDGTGGTSGSGSSGGTDGTSTAGNGSDDGSGVGSGGTGVSTADATGIGAVGGLGSIILNGVRYNTDGVSPGDFSLEDATELQIGMSVRIAGKIDSEFTAATAQQVASAAELRGAVSAIDVAGGSFVVMGTTVTIDNATVWSGANSLAGLTAGSVVQVWGLPTAPGSLRATRVELAPASSEPLVTGFVQRLDPLTNSFTLGLLTVRYNDDAFSGGIDESTLSGAIVRVRGRVAPDSAGAFTATKVQGWYAIPTQNAAAVQLAGVITNYSGLGAFKVLGTAIDASNAQVTGGPQTSIGNGVKVELDGFMTNGVLVVKKLRIRYVPGTGGPVSYTLIGPIGYYQSASNFIVKGQRVDASGLVADDFENGTAADLASGRRVTVVGDTVVDGVLIAKRITFTPP